METSDALRRNLPAVGAAVRSIIIFIAVLSIPLTAAQALALSPTETSSWILALYGLPGLLSLFLALRYRQPLLVTVIGTAVSLLLERDGLRALRAGEE
jgi:predicted benzoate:H+ symporter BenE